MKDLIISRPLYLKDKDCGYCHGSKSIPFSLRSFREAHNEGTPQFEERPESISIGFQVHSMSMDQYDACVNKGFRRSGNFLYKPDNLRNCCRMYTIRTSPNFKPLKEHRSCINRFYRSVGAEEVFGKNAPFDYVERIVKLEESTQRFYTRFEPPTFTQDKFDLFRKYQIAVHNDEPDSVSPESFKRFLCETPFENVEGSWLRWSTLNGWKSGIPSSDSYWDSDQIYGPAHECYYIDNSLVGIAVLDIMPSGLSSVYFIWDPAYAKLGLGTLSGLREMAICHKLNLPYYYLGYYIGDCQKMKYKAKFGGEILDASRNCYIPLSQPGFLPVLQTGELFTSGQECELSDDDPSLFRGAFANMAESVYGFPSGSAYSQGETAIKDLKEYSNQDDSDLLTTEEALFSMPKVIPGVMPLWQAKESAWILNCRIFSLSTGAITKWCRGSGYSRNVNRAVIDTLRLLGLRLTLQAIIMV